MSIPNLMAVPDDRRGVDWLMQSLQFAIQLELATIPPYLCAMWSIVDPDDETGVKFYIRRIVLEEMRHMGLACNMLTTLGGTPKINDPTTVPTYPGRLPGGVRPELIVWLGGFSRAMVRAVFMEIEYPEQGPIAHFMDESYPTIGGFYGAILAAFKILKPTDIKGERQITEPILHVTPILSVVDAEQAIKVIKEQGEGTSQNPFPSDDPFGRAHYYRFAELYYGRELVKLDGRWQYAGTEIMLPPAFPMVDVPSGGYSESRDFDALYTTILDDLQMAWAMGGQGGQAALDRAINTMKRDLEGPARELMQRPLPSGHGNYGPSFMLVRK